MTHFIEVTYFGPLSDLGVIDITPYDGDGPNYGFTIGFTERDIHPEDPYSLN